MAGAVVGPLLLGVYFRLADFVGINTSELFAASASSLQVLPAPAVSPDGDLTIYPIGIRDVFHRWKLLPEAPDGPPIAPAGVDPARWHHRAADRHHPHAATTGAP